MAKFPIQRADLTVPGVSGSIQSNVDVRTGQADVFNAIAGVAQEISKANEVMFLKAAATETAMDKAFINDTTNSLIIAMKKETDPTRYQKLKESALGKIRSRKPKNTRSAQEYRDALPQLESNMNLLVFEKQLQRTDENYGFATAKLQAQTVASGDTSILEAHLNRGVAEGIIPQDEADLRLAQVQSGVTRTAAKLQQQVAISWFQSKAFELDGDWNEVLQLAIDPKIQKQLGIDFAQAKDIVSDLQTMESIASGQQAEELHQLQELQRTEMNTAFNKGNYFEARRLSDASDLPEKERQEFELDTYKAAELKKKARTTEVQEDTKRLFYDEIDKGNFDAAIQFMKNDRTHSVDDRRVYINHAERAKELIEKKRLADKADALARQEKATKAQKELAKETRLDSREAIEANFYEIFYAAKEESGFKRARDKIALMEHHTGKERFDFRVLVDEKEQLLTDKKPYDPVVFSDLKLQALRLQSQQEFDTFLRVVNLNEIAGIISEPEAETVRGLSPDKLDANIRRHTSELTGRSFNAVMGQHLSKDDWLINERLRDPEGDILSKLEEFTRIQTIKRWAASNAQQDIINQILLHPEWDRDQREAEELRITRTASKRVDISNLHILEEDYKRFLNLQ